MKIRTLVVSALAGLALSGLFASTAGAEEMQELTYCGPFDPAEEAYLQDPSRTMQEIQEAWKVNKVRYCTSAVVPAAEVLNAAHDIEICLESRSIHWSKADAEACIAEWYSRSGTTEFRHQVKRHHKAKGKHPKPKRHQAERHGRGGIALASSLG